MKMVIVGHGFVGKAVDFGFSSVKDKTIIDPIYGNSIKDVEEFDYAFVCVPTPMGEDGSIDASIITECVQELLAVPKCGVIIIKSTVTPAILEVLTENRINIVYNPEFLTERNAKHDFVNPTMHVFGSSNVSCGKAVEELYLNYSSCKVCPIFHMSVKEASFVKYGINSFLASKVLWFNQFFNIVENNGANYNKIISAIGTDQRIGSSHTNVPGFDGKKGYGGACFTKDVNALLKFAPEFSLLQQVNRENNIIRSRYSLDDREIEQHVQYKVA